MRIFFSEKYTFLGDKNAEKKKKKKKKKEKNENFFFGKIYLFG